MMNIVPWRGAEIDGMTNDDIALVAKEKNLEYFDLHSLYLKKEEQLGEFSLRTRFIPLSDLPKEYHKILAPFTQFVQWKNTDMVRVNTNEFDPVFGHIPDWYKDPHPNTPGYRFIADETAKYLLPKLKGE